MLVQHRSHGMPGGPVLIVKLKQSWEQALEVFVLDSSSALKDSGDIGVWYSGRSRPRGGLNLEMHAYT